MRPILCATLLAAAVFGCSSDSPQALRVHRGAFTSTMVITGELAARQGIDISVPPLPTWESSIKWMVEDGSYVRAGDRVVELDAGALPTRLETLRQEESQNVQELQQRDSETAADLEQKRLEIEKKSADAAKARMQAEVPRDILSPREYEQRQLALKRAETELAKAKETYDAALVGSRSERANLALKIDRAQREIERSAAALQTIFLRAPRDGIFVGRDLPWEGRSLRVGDRVWVGFALGSMPDLDTLQVTASLADVDDGRVQPGMEAWVTVDGYPGERFHGKVTGISAVAQESGRNTQRRFFRVTVNLDRIDKARMRPGLSTRVEIVRQRRASVLLASRDALRVRGKKASARLSDGRIVDVTVGSCSARECEILSGLQDGQRLRRFAEAPDA